ncbi:hypothetical protein FRC10_010697 [Ceratobasidium sp. 414]|nr:hypothetical protein FRC10_010697 [Ceratobasidium sp. 414]
MPAAANLEDICAANSAHQVSRPFSEFKCLPDGKYFRCTLCLRAGGLWTTYANRSDGLTGLLRKHLEKDPGLTYRSKCEAEGVIPRGADGDIDSDNKESTSAGVRDPIARLAAIDDQAMRAVERREFVRLLIYCSRARVALHRRDIPHRSRIIKAMHELNLTEKSRIIDEMKFKIFINLHNQNAQGSISITSDLWSGISIDGSHTGVNLGQYMFSVFEEPGITNKIGFITLDNATNNDTLTRELESVFVEQRIKTFGRESNRIRRGHP